MEAKKREHPVYTEQYKSQAVELMIHSGKTQRQVARELDVSEYSLNLWKKAYLGQQAQPRSMPMLHKRAYTQRFKNSLSPRRNVLGKLVAFDKQMATRVRNNLC